ncbi:DNA-nicking Smr family endonuclease [Oxalobacteraceae bacterium GrIS 1.18]
MKRAPIKDLNELGGLRSALKQRAEQEKLAEQQRQLEQRAAEKNANLFKQNIGAVTPIKTPDTYLHPRPTVTTAAVKNKPKEITSMAEAMQDIEQWSDDFHASQLEEEDGSSYAIKGSSPALLDKLRKGQWPVQAFLDLHGMQRDQARTALADFLRRSKLARLRSVCIIHGKGIHSRDTAILPGKVRSWLTQSELVQAFCPASAQDGGEGALQVLLLSSQTDA